MSNEPKKERQVGTQEYRLLLHCFYGYWPRRVEESDAIPYNCISSDQMFRLSDTSLFDIGLLFFPFFSLSFHDFFPKKDH